MSGSSPSKMEIAVSETQRAEEYLRLGTSSAPINPELARELGGVDIQ